MHIAFIEVKYFRKLVSVRIDLEPEKTVLVGANNSGKTSAMVALRSFLVRGGDVHIRDFNIANWSAITVIGEKWALPAGAGSPQAPTLAEWSLVLPFVDVWIDAAAEELGYVRGMLPTLDWNGGLLGVRLRFEPKDAHNLAQSYLAARRHVVEATKDKGVRESSDLLWPKDLFAFLEKEMGKHFVIQAYLLDPAKVIPPMNGLAKPQELAANAVPLPSNPLTGLIRIHEIGAQRGFGDSGRIPDEGSVSRPTASGGDARKLSVQLKRYYAKHLNPFDKPTSTDIDALEAIGTAQKMFDTKLSECFATAIAEVENMGYPGVTDPILKISTRILPSDGLNHDAAVQYEVAVTDGTKRVAGLRLPENYNGLGYQNLISMLFTLMSFRDEWMCVGKADAENDESEEVSPIPPMHLVLLEEPEAHLHVQVQQVFIRKAYDVLTKHPKLVGKSVFSTQLLVSTHSSHVAHELPFRCLRYFRRLPSGRSHGSPVTAVENLSDMYGSKVETDDFVTRYLRSSSFDVFFADAVICIEGQAERMLLPHFIRSQFRELDHRYLSVLELGGSHAHRLRPLLERLGVIVLIITDLDAKDAKTNMSVVPAIGTGQESRNVTLREWIPKQKTIDALMKCTPAERTQDHPDGFSIRAAYQMPQSITLSNKTTDTVFSNTFEDAFVFSNLELLAGIGDKHGIASKLCSAINTAATGNDLVERVNKIVETMRKAEFALDVLTLDDLKKMAAPPYIAEGLTWLQDNIRSRSVDSLIISTQKSGDTDGKH